MTQYEIINQFCMLATDVGDRVFANEVPSDCFCQGSSMNNFQMDPKVFEFICDAVGAAINNHKKERETEKLLR